MDHALNVVEAGGARFGKLSVRDRFRILADLKKRSIEEANARLAAVKLPAEQEYVERRQAQERTFGDADFIGHINTGEGQDAVLSIALRRADAKADPAAVLDSLTLTTGELLKLVAELCGLKIVVQGEDAGADPTAKGEPQPEKPMVYGK